MTTLLLRSNLSALRVLAVPLTLLLSGCGSGDSFHSTGDVADGSLDGEGTANGSVGGTGSLGGGVHGSMGGANGSGGVHGSGGGADGSGGVHGSGGGASGSGGVHGSSAGASGSGGVHGSGGGASGSGGVHGSSGGASGSGGVHGSSGGASGSGGIKGSFDAGADTAGDAGRYVGPSVGSAKPFAALAYSAITTANISSIVGEIGVSAGAVSTITGFDAPSYTKYGLDSLAPYDHRTALAQADVTALVGNIDPRACDVDYTNVVGGLTGDITLYPGVTCMNSFSADVLLNGHVYLDARGDPNAFFIIRGNLTLTVADGAQVVLMNGAEACGVFWRISKQVTIGKTVKFYGTVIAGSAITMATGSTLVGRALAQTAGVHLDANAITIPSDGLVGSAGVCTHVQ